MRRLGRAPKVLGIPVSTNTVKDLAKATKDLLLKQYVDEETAKERLEICYKCPHMHGNRCSICGCFMRKKAALRSSSCPIDKWSTSQLSIDDTHHEEGNEQRSDSKSDLVGTHPPPFESEEKETANSK